MELSILCLSAAAALVLAAACGAAFGADAPADLVQNPDFSAAGEKDMPAQWKAWTPVCQNASASVRQAPGGLLVESPKEPYGVGGVEQKLAGIRGRQAYAIDVAAELRGIASPLQAAIVRLTWTRGKDPLHPAGMLVRGPQITGAAATFADVLVAPPDADGALLSLEVKWPQGGTVLWKRASVRPAPAPPPRLVKVGTVYLRPKNSTPEKNLELFAAQVDTAGKLGLDIVCLSEAITQIGTGRTVADLAQPIPGPASERLGAAARANRLWLVAGLTERDADRVYNTAVLLDREGKLAGKYRKIHLPREEWRQGVTPGHEYPVFKTDFGTIAIQICYDWFFPEPEEIFARQGAEILFAPTWGDTMADADGRANGETVFRVRARDNGLYLVPAVYDGQSMIIDPMGRILASNKGREGVFWAEIDLSARECLPWVGHWRDIGPRDRMPDTYGPLTERK
jgi:predicted amidohydrolase